MKQSVTQKILSDAANRVSSQRGIGLSSSNDEFYIPNEKTITAYESALDRALETFWKYGCDDDVIRILNDAKKYNRIPKRYISQPVKSFHTCNVYVRKAYISIEKGKVKAHLYISFGNISITSNMTKITKEITIDDNLGKIVDSIRETIQKIEKIIA